MTDLLGPLGARVRALRRAHRLTQQELADAVGYGRPSIANLEAGRQNTPLPTLAAIAAHFKVPIGALLGEVPLPGIAVITTKLVLSCSLCDWVEKTFDPTIAEGLSREHEDQHLAGGDDHG